jgi:hypothetical protein
MPGYADVLEPAPGSVIAVSPSCGTRSSVRCVARRQIQRKAKLEIGESISSCQEAGLERGEI